MLSKEVTVLRRMEDLRGFTIAATDGDIKVLVAPSWIERVDRDHAKLHVLVTRARIKNSPEYDPTKPVQRDYETRLYEHHGQPHYWGEYRPAEV